MFSSFQIAFSQLFPAFFQQIIDSVNTSIYTLVVMVLSKAPKLNNIY